MINPKNEAVNNACLCSGGVYELDYLTLLKNDPFGVMPAVYLRTMMDPRWITDDRSASIPLIVKEWK